MAIEYVDTKKIYKPKTMGACGGVVMAVRETEWALDTVDEVCINGRKPEVWANHAIVHNVPEMERLQDRGLRVFENDWDLVPDLSIVIGSAHGSPKEYAAMAAAKRSFFLNLACPLVIGNQKKVEAAVRRGSVTLVIGKKGHPEAESYVNRGDPDNTLLIAKPDDVARLTIPSNRQIEVVTQTTLAVKGMDPIFTALEQKYGQQVAFNTLPSTMNGIRRGTICGATDYRQAAVEQLVELGIQGLVVVGSEGSHNSEELARIAENAQLPTYLIDKANKLKASWFKELQIVGLTAGASANKREVNEVLEWFRLRNPGLEVTETEKIDPKEKDDFPLKDKTRIDQELRDYLQTHYAA